MNNKILTYLFLFFIEICPAQDDLTDTVSHYGTPFKLTDSIVRGGQIYDLFNLSFSKTDSGLKVISNKNIDSVYSFLMGRRWKFFIICNEKENKIKNDCKRIGWKKAEAIRKYFLAKGMPDKKIVLIKSMCWTADEQKNYNWVTKSDGFVRFYVFD